MPKGFTDHEKDLIRARLLSAGDSLFSTHGLKKARVEDLAAAARISTGAFYQFFESKEALLLAVFEQAEQRFRQDLLAAIDRPGPSPRARLLSILQQAFALLHTVPVLRLLTSSDYDLLVRRVPDHAMRAHVASDLRFFETFVARCREAAIPIQVAPPEISALLYPLILAAMHPDLPQMDPLRTSIDPLLELIAAYCLGEVVLHTQPSSVPGSTMEEKPHP
ncbi:MAG: TetR/AcrR family transcriptional regulator [Chloroflexales bacterium]|nr:TetR/AcrR family transcriptional regulator [Chloroflexales bacterium]